MNIIRSSLTLVVAAFLGACGGGVSSNSAVPDGKEAATSAVVAPIAIAKPGKADGIQITVKSVEQRSTIGGGGYGPKVEPGETFVVVRYAMKNTADKPLQWSSRPEVSLVDAKGQVYASDSTAGVMAAGMNNDIQDALSDLNPNVSAKSTAVWKVDKATFNRATWKLAFASDPALTFALR